MVDDGFDSMVVSVIDAVGYGVLSEDQEVRLRRAISTALKLTWNTRGKADLAKLELPVSRIHGAIQALDKDVEVG